MTDYQQPTYAPPEPLVPPKREHTRRGWAIGIAALALVAGSLVACSSTATAKHVTASSSAPSQSPSASSASSTAPAGTDPAVYSAKLSELSTALGSFSDKAATGDETAAKAACATGVAVVHDLQAMPWPTGPAGAGADSMKSALAILDKGFNACTLGDFETTTTDIESGTAYLTAATAALGG